MELLRTQVAFGPRVPGSEAHEKAGAWIRARLEESAPRVVVRRFRGSSALTGETFEGMNLRASFRPEIAERVFFGAHWDTRARADMDPDPARRSEAVPGANDGASGTAILLHLAEAMRENPPPVGVDLLFFDGEDQGGSGDPGGYCLGARAFAASAALTGFAPRYGVVIDLVGHRDLRIIRERQSVDCCSDLVEKVMGIGARIAPPVFDGAGVVYLYDDHVPFLEAGLPVIVLSGYGYPEWHTTADLPGICSEESLQAVGATLLHLIYGDDEMP